MRGGTTGDLTVHMLGSMMGDQTQMTSMTIIGLSQTMAMKIQKQMKNQLTKHQTHNKQKVGDKMTKQEEKNQDLMVNQPAREKGCFQGEMLKDKSGEDVQEGEETPQMMKAAMKANQQEAVEEDQPAAAAA